MNQLEPHIDDPELEGLGTSEDDGWGNYPIDNILIRTEARTVYEVVRRMDKTYVLDPEFQRDFVWDTKKQSKLIESVLMRIPLPVFYLAEDDDGRMIVVDGLQRLTTFQRFLSGNLRLDIKREELDGKCFADLAPKLQNRVEDCNLTFYIIDPKVPETVRLDIFERVNLGVPLSRQQMRNCLYQGPATAFLKEAAHSALFLDTTGRGFRTTDMRDREAINRYCAFRLLELRSYKGDMDDFLATVLKHLNRNPGQIAGLDEGLRRSLAAAQALFGKHAFRKHAPQQTSRNPINVGLWDVMSTGLAGYSLEHIRHHEDELREGFYDLLAEDEFADAITIGTNHRRKVLVRFERFGRYLSEIIGDAS